MGSDAVLVRVEEYAGAQAVEDQVIAAVEHLLEPRRIYHPGGPGHGITGEGAIGRRFGHRQGVPAGWPRYPGIGCPEVSARGVCA